MAFILRRLAFYVVAAWVALTVNFFIPRAVPGNAVEAIMAKFPNLTPLPVPAAVLVRHRRVPGRPDGAHAGRQDRRPHPRDDVPVRSPG